MMCLIALLEVNHWLYMLDKPYGYMPCEVCLVVKEVARDSMQLPPFRVIECLTKDERALYR